jgi:hypothetical protein
LYSRGGWLSRCRRKLLNLLDFCAALPSSGDARHLLPEGEGRNELNWRLPRP